MKESKVWKFAGVGVRRRCRSRRWRGRIKRKDNTLAFVASGGRHAIENVVCDYETAMRLVADGVVKAQEHLVASTILANRKDDPVVVCSTVQRGPVQ
jgi:hypothetical protein